MSNSGFEHLNKEILDKVSRVVEGTDDQFLHVFGGRRQHKGATPQGCKMPLHLLYTFDTTDPAFPIKVPGIRYLPLYYSFPYNAGACGYRVKSDTEIEVLYMETKEVEPDFPYERMAVALLSLASRTLRIRLCRDYVFTGKPVKQTQEFDEINSLNPLVYSSHPHPFSPVRLFWFLFWYDGVLMPSDDVTRPVKFQCWF